MTIKIIAPDDDKKEFFEKSVKPLLSTAMENNAVDKWMFNIEDDGEVNDESVVFVSSKHMKVFIINGVKETEPPYWEMPDYKGPRMRRLGDPIAARMRRQAKQARQLEVTRHGNPRPRIVEEKWSAGIEYWDIGNSRYTRKTAVIRSPNNMPSLETLCECIDFELWADDKLPSWFLSEDAHLWFVQREGSEK